ncbi:hypothetical protein QFC19_003765 [Naganishia cerealis]|uniref:Uncharacterized protein n=1 Tax=Naganishia cerealis TaxID=610337 RepID=A0ACC2W0J3_9TREE|nr:hypothetical protein QFC19_003765 [Naganishia cerealis]
MSLPSCHRTALGVLSTPSDDVRSPDGLLVPERSLRLAAGQTVTQDVIDFCLSPRGLLLQPKREYLAYPYAATEIRSKVLTVAEGQAWFFRRAEERRGLIRRIEPWRYDYVFGFKRYKAAESSFEKILLPDAEFVLYPESLDGVNVAQGILITFIQMLRVIDRRPHIPPEARTLALNGFGIPPSVKEVELHVRLFPQGIMAWWRVWLDAEAKGFPEALFYMIYKERINVRLPPPTLRVTRLRGSTTGEDI